MAMRNYVISATVSRALLAMMGSSAALFGSACASIRHQSGAQPATAAPAETAAATTAMPPASPSPGLSPGAGHNLLANATFDGGKSLPWMTSFSVPADGKASVVNGEYCVEVKNKGS